MLKCNKFQMKDKYTFEDLVKLTQVLRGPGGCPWDAEQTHKSIKRNFLEEVYEAVEAIDAGNIELLKEELGDVLAQVVFHAQIEAELNNFNIDDVADGVCKKFIYRHPHVFSDVECENSQQVLKAWDELKRVEKGQKSQTESLNSVARSLPSLWRADKLLAKASKAGLDYMSVNPCLDVYDNKNSGDNIEKTIGDMLFYVVYLARQNGLDPEFCLHSACEKFIENFSRVEEEAKHKGKSISDMSIEEIENKWNK